MNAQLGISHRRLPPRSRTNSRVTRCLFKTRRPLRNFGLHCFVFHLVIPWRKTGHFNAKPRPHINMRSQPTKHAGVAYIRTCTTRRRMYVAWRCTVTTVYLVQRTVAACVVVLWPQSLLSIIRMKNQRGHQGCAWCRRVERMV